MNAKKSLLEKCEGQSQMDIKGLHNAIRGALEWRTSGLNVSSQLQRG